MSCQHRFRRGIRPVLPRILGQLRGDLPGRPGLATRGNSRIEALHTPLKIGKSAIALSIGGTRQEHMRLLTPWPDIGRLHDQAVELRRQTRNSLGTKGRCPDPHSITYSTLIVPCSIAWAMAASCAQPWPALASPISCAPRVFGFLSARIKKSSSSSGAPRYRTTCGVASTSDASRPAR